MSPYGTCSEQVLPRPLIGKLICDRERDHPGSHFDREVSLYWMPGAPKLETIEVGRTLAGKESDR